MTLSGVYILNMPSFLPRFPRLIGARRGHAFLLLHGLTGGVALAVPTAARAASALCADGLCQPAITKTTYFARPAYRLTDGNSEAIIVPALGRIMSFGKVGGPNLLWNSPTPSGINWGWINYGGDKTWLAPQSEWPTWNGSGWPPEKAIDGSPYQAEVMSGGKLRLTAPLSAGTGLRLSRTLYFNEAGELVIEQTIVKEKGAPVRAALWSITQAIPGEAIFLPLNPNSAYKNGYFTLMTSKKEQAISLVSPTLLKYEPKTSGDGNKIGLDSPVSALASVRDGVALVQKAEQPAGRYPDGADGAGFPVEFYVNGDPKVFYCELELLGPLKTFKVGGKSTYTVRWSLHDLPSKDLNSPAVVDAINGLIYSPCDCGGWNGPCRTG